MKHSIDLNESEIHLLRVTIKNVLEECNEYLDDPAVDQEWNLTKTVLNKMAVYQDLSKRLTDLSSI